VLPNTEQGKEMNVDIQGIDILNIRREQSQRAREVLNGVFRVILSPDVRFT